MKFLGILLIIFGGFWILRFIRSEILNNFSPLSIMGLKLFILNNWQSFILSVFAGLVVLFLVNTFRIPEFDLHLDYIPGKMTARGYSLPVLDISVFNKKPWIGFGGGDINFGLFLPIEFVYKKHFFLITKEGRKEWIVDTRGKDKFVINNENYYLYRGVVDMAVHPGSRVHFLRIGSDFKNDKDLKVYYYFETPYGNFPKFLKLGNRIENAESGKLPLKEIGFD